MSDTIARRYAGALAEQAAADGVTLKVDADMQFVRDALDESAELVRFFGSPVIPRGKKLDVIRSLFEGRIEPVSLRFMELLVEKQRENLFSSVVAAYQALRDDQMGITEVSVRSARSLSEEDQNALVASLEQKIGKKVRLSVDLEPELLGGIVVRVGDTVYDGSLANRLSTLKERLRTGAVITH